MKSKLEKRVFFDKAHVYPCKYKNLNNIPHWHTEYELIFVESGTVTVTADGNLFTLTEGMSLFLHQGTVHSIFSAADAVTVVIKAEGTYFEALFGRKKLVSPLLSKDYGFAAYMEELFGESAKRDEYSGLLADSITTRLFAHILRGEPIEEISREDSSSAERYKLLLEQIAENYAYVTFEDAADFMHFSRPYFSKYFLERTGMTFTRYLNTVRISCAVERIKKGEGTMTEISRSCGFNTIRNFNRVFKEFTGYSPRSLPKSYRFVHEMKDYTDKGFDPTLSVTSVVRT